MKWKERISTIDGSLFCIVMLRQTNSRLINWQHWNSLGIFEFSTIFIAIFFLFFLFESNMVIFLIIRYYFIYIFFVSLIHFPWISLYFFFLTENFVGLSRWYCICLNIIGDSYTNVNVRCENKIKKKKFGRSKKKNIFYFVNVF